MLRLNRGQLWFSAAALAAGLLASPISAQTPDQAPVPSHSPTPNQAQPPAPAHPAQSAHSKPTHPKPAHHAPATAASGRLAVRLRLGDGRQTWHPTRKKLGVRYLSGSDASGPGAFKFTVDRAALRSYLVGIAPYVKRQPKDAKVVVGNVGGSDNGMGEIPAHVVPGYDGAVLDVSAAVDAVQKEITTNPGVLHIVLPVKSKKANVTAADLKGINARVGYFVTRFNPGDGGRTQTVRLAIQIIDGTVVPPGGVFSVNQMVGEPTAARGIGTGHVFVAGKIGVSY